MPRVTGQNEAEGGDRPTVAGPLLYCPWPAESRVVLAVVLVVAGIGLGVAGLSSYPRSGQPFLVAPTLVVDPNTAPPEVLSALPQIGPGLVKQIVTARKIRPFTSLPDLLRVRGIGPATLARIAPHLRFDDREAPSQAGLTPGLDHRSRPTHLARARAVPGPS